MNKAIGQKWEDIEQEIFTPEEIAESDLRVAVICKFIKKIAERKPQTYSLRRSSANSGY